MLLVKIRLWRKVSQCSSLMQLLLTKIFFLWVFAIVTYNRLLRNTLTIDCYIIVINKLKIDNVSVSCNYFTKILDKNTLHETFYNAFHSFTTNQNQPSRSCHEQQLLWKFEKIWKNLSKWRSRNNCRSGTFTLKMYSCHCVKSVCIRSYSGPHFPAFGLNTERYRVSLRMRENADQNNSEYRHFSRSVH